MSTKLPGLRAQMSLSAVAASAPQQFRLFDRHALPAVPAEPKRRRIWELSGNFHCSIIGTCLTTSELRHVLIKMQLPGAEKESDHELHGRAVLLAQKRDQASKQLQKALDRRHRLIVNQFNKARTTDELRTLWAAAVQRAEIPGAYWAVLTHPQVSEDLARHAFGEVHMLSHLVGAANRADIRRLRDLEGENAALQEKLARQQKQLRDAVVTRDATIANLNEALGKAIVSARQDDSTPSFPAGDAERDATVHLVRDLRRRLALEAAGRERLGSVCTSLWPNLTWKGSSGSRQSNASAICRRRSTSLSFRSQHRLLKASVRAIMRLILAALLSFTLAAVRTMCRSCVSWRNARARRFFITTAA